MADNTEVIFQDLRGDLNTLNRAIYTLTKRLHEQDAKTMPEDYTPDEAIKVAITYGGYFARHLKRACRDLKEGPKPTSVSLQVSGVAITWDISQ